MAAPFIPPPAFDPGWVRETHPALAHLDDAALAAQFERTGRAAGQAGSPYALRENLLALIGARRLLEIGPFDRPLRRGDNVRYLDALDADALRARAATMRGRDPAGVPDIHHVGDLGEVEARFDALLSSHAIEHQPDLVVHLQAAERVLDPGGAFFLIVPDKRYCFDHYLRESTIADVLEARGRTRHTLAHVIEHRALTTHNIALRHWQGDHGDPERARTARIEGALAEYEAAAGRYIDVHAWYFTPASFGGIIRDLNGLGLTGFAATVYDTPYGRNEFCAILTRD